MTILESVQEEFERIRQQDIEAYEAELKAIKQGENRLLQRQKIVNAGISAVAKEYGVDLRKLHTINEQEERDITAYIEEVRAGFLTRTSPVTEDLRTKAMYQPALEQAGIDRAEFVGMYLLAPEGLSALFSRYKSMILSNKNYFSDILYSDRFLENQSRKSRQNKSFKPFGISVTASLA